MISHSVYSEPGRSVKVGTLSYCICLYFQMNIPSQNFNDSHIADLDESDDDGLTDLSNSDSEAVHGMGRWIWVVGNVRNDLIKGETCCSTSKEIETIVIVK